MEHNLILLADAYKYSHHKLYTPGTKKIYSYLESRGGHFNETLFYGLQYSLKRYFEGRVITTEKIQEAEQLMPQVFGRNDVFDAALFQRLLDKHDGHLPVRIKAVPEGTVVPTHNVLMTIENTDDEFYWLPNFLETLIMQVWYPTTVATLSFQIRKAIEQAYKETASEDAFNGIDFVLNDFGFRGVSSVESAGLGGSAHLLNFSGSDTIAGSMLACQYYQAEKMYGLSIPATEHSICTLLGEQGEKEIFEHILRTFPSGTIACVSDSYDILRACRDYWGTTFKEILLSRQGTLVIRPDSGDPIMTLRKVFAILFEKFGFHVNAKGFKVLPPQIRVIQGDGINYESILQIYKALKQEGIAAENLVLGMGGALLQKVDRDTQKFALKCSWAEVNGKGISVMKDPTEIDAMGNAGKSFKKSKPGRLKLIQVNGELRTVSEPENPMAADLLETVFENGHMVKEYRFDEIRNRAASFR